MRLSLIAVGRLKSGPERELCERYTERFGQLAKGLGFQPLRLVEIAESRASSAQARKTEEARAILAAVPDGHDLLLLDERGEAIGTEAFTGKIASARDSGRAGLAFAIGGPDGLDAALRARASAVIPFGAMTVPHQLARVLLLEQLYRAATLIAGHPYHRP
jgi:23S rRNA (pseudouridine1915-N3)-methyltransferase